MKLTESFEKKRAQEKEQRQLIQVGSIALMIALALLLNEISTQAGVEDGTLLNVSTLLDSGDPVGKIDIVFLGDGFTADEQDTFNDKVNEAVNFFLDSHPFGALRSAFNIHRVNVASRESGIDIPATCMGEPTGSTEQVRATAMDTTYCAGSVFRCVGSTNTALVFMYAANAPAYDFIMVLVNDEGHGGCRFGTVTYSTIKDLFEEIVVHELGHALANLADEYDYDSEVSTYTGTEPIRANITIAENRDELKWNDIVLGSVSIPTQEQTNCDDPAYPSSPVAFDIVGTFEGSNYHRCGIYRPQSNCRMRKSDQPFCSVCRRKIIQDICPFTGTSFALTFNELLIRDDHDGFFRGSGDIYFNYTAASNSETVSGRWPGSSGESDFDSGDSKTLNFFAAALPEPRVGSSGSIGIRVRESDWPDGDDTLSDDATHNFTSPGIFEIDQSDYRLTGDIRNADLKVLLDMLNIKEDMDIGAGDIYVRYSISNGDQTIEGRWPSGGTKGMDDGNTEELAVLSAAIPQPIGDNVLSIRIVVRDEDSWYTLTFGDDNIGDDTFTFSASQNFGADNIVHVRDQSNYRITFSIVGCPPRVPGPG